MRLPLLQQVTLLVVPLLLLEVPQLLVPLLPLLPLPPLPPLLDAHLVVTLLDVKVVVQVQALEVPHFWFLCCLCWA